MERLTGVNAPSLCHIRKQATPISWDMSEATLACGLIALGLKSAMAVAPAYE